MSIELANTKGKLCSIEVWKAENGRAYRKAAVFVEWVLGDLVVREQAVGGKRNEERFLL